MSTAKTDTQQAPDADDQLGARFAALEQIKAQAKRDAGEALQSLRDEVKHYRSLKETSDEAIDIACDFTLRYSDDWGSVVGLEATTGCELQLDYDCDDDIGQSGITLSELNPISARVSYSRDVFVRVEEITSDLNDLLIEMQAIVGAFEEM